LAKPPVERRKSKAVLGKIRSFVKSILQVRVTFGRGVGGTWRLLTTKSSRIPKRGTPLFLKKTRYLFKTG